MSSDDGSTQRGKRASESVKNPLDEVSSDPSPGRGVIVVEFLGVARRRAGVDQISVRADTVGDALTAVAEELPQFAANSLQDGRLNRAFIMSLNGRVFTDNRDLHLEAGDHLVILTADAGG